MEISRLREATAADHEAVEGSVPLVSPDLNRLGYIAVLERLHGIVAAWESYAQARAPEWMRPYLDERRRLALLDRDLLVLGRVPPDGDRPEMPTLNGDAALLGAAYVMEGSRLGGQLIARHVEKQLGLRSGEGDAYFVGFGDSTGAKWKELVALIERRVPDAEEDLAIGGAKAMFGAFGRWMGGL